MTEIPLAPIESPRIRALILPASVMMKSVTSAVPDPRNPVDLKKTGLKQESLRIPVPSRAARRMKRNATSVVPVPRKPVTREIRETVSAQTRSAGPGLNRTLSRRKKSRPASHHLEMTVISPKPGRVQLM